MKNYMSGFATLSKSDAGGLTVEELTANPGWTNPNVSGVRLRLSHGVICPTQNTRDWTLLNVAVNLARTYGKRLRLCVVGGYLTAEWVYGLGVTKYTSANGDGSQPLPWDLNWQAIWFAFIDELASHIVPFSSPHLVDALSLERDPIIADIIPCGFMTEAGMYFGDADDATLMPHSGFSDVYSAYVSGAEAICAKYASAWPTTPIEVTFVTPFPTPQGHVAGNTVKDFLINSFPQHGGNMISSVFAVQNPTAPVIVPFPHSGQQFQPCYGNPNPEGLYQHGTPIPDPIPPFDQIFVSMCLNALSKGMRCLEIYGVDATHVPAATLAAMKAKFQINSTPTWTTIGQVALMP